MEQEKFIDEIVKKYKEARKPLFSEEVDQIKRGTSRSISSIAEDLFGRYCYDKIEDKEKEIWVDPQLTFPGLKNKSGERRLLIRPDICIYNPKNYKIECMFDLKMDLGYKRKDFVEQAKERSGQIKKIKSRSCECSIVSKGEKIEIDSDLSFVYVVASDGNIASDKYKKIIEEISDIINVPLYTLTKGGHLNDYSGKKDWEINSDFDAFDMFLSRF